MRKPDSALDPASPLVQDPALRKPGPLAATNTLEEWQFGWGRVEEARAACVIENDYVFPMVTHFAIEPHAFLAAPDEHGVTIWSPIQHPYVLQRVVAAALKWPLSRVRIVAPDPGGAFGGNGWPKFEPLMVEVPEKGSGEGQRDRLKDLSEAGRRASRARRKKA